MFLHLVFLLSLSWPRVLGNAKLQDQATFDQVATASENVVQSTGKLEQKAFREQLIPSMIDTTVHYENSNGFVPMMASSASKLPDALDRLDATSLPGASNVTTSDSSNEPNDNDSNVIDKGFKEEETRNKIENDPAYSSEAGIFINFPNANGNRRSFEYQGGQNEFELLKVTNDTPIVANYQNFFEDSSSSVDSKNAETRSSPRHRATSGKGQKTENYTGNYGTVVNESKDVRSSYEDYYSHNAAKDKEKKSQVKANGNYHQQDAFSYDGHGQTATRQNGPTTFFPRTNQQVNVPANNKPNDQDDRYDSVASSSQVVKNHQRFSRPVVVAETSYNFHHQSSDLADLNLEDHQNDMLVDSGSSEASHRYAIRDRDGKFRNDDDSRDSSDEGEYVEYTERPRRTQKGRRRPSSGDNSKRLQKEHRGSSDDSSEYESKRHHSNRSKSHRQRVRGNSWMDDDRHQDQDDSYEDSRYDGRQSSSETRYTKPQQSSKFKLNNGWNQVSPNMEISHSSGIEIGQLEKPKLIVPFKVNIVPVANFDHATAIGNSQGFDVSNAVLNNIVSATQLNAVSTPSPTENEQQIRVSSPVPDIIVGQNNYQNSFQAILPQSNDQNKYSANFKPQYVSSTVAPVFAVTPSVNPTLQGIAVQDFQGASTPRPTFLGATNQHPSTGQAQANVQQLVVPQPTVQTVQTVPALLHTPVSSSDFNIQVNPHGMHGQNPIDQGNLQLQAVSTMPTVTSTAQTIPVTKFNFLAPESQDKKNGFPGSSTNFLASASLAVGQNEQKQMVNGNSYYLQNSHNQQIVKPQIQAGLYNQMLKNTVLAPKTKTYFQTTHLVPALLHPMPTIATISASTPQIFSEHQNNGADNHSSQKNAKLPTLTYQTVDNMGSQTISNFNAMNAFPGVSGIADTAHLPNVGTRNVEIVNPNIKPSPVDTNVVNSFEAMHYPAAVLTTSIPMFTTTSIVTARPALLSTTTAESSHVQNFVNSLTEIGNSKNNQQSFGELKAYPSQERPVFNPINFIPNMDLMKNQNALNSKLHASEPLQQNLNLVPLVPGGNFFKPSFSAQSELFVKPKLTSDLASYAEQMFKESLKTIYNSQKWNNDRKPGNQVRQNSSESADIAKLKSELQRLKASLYESKRNKEQLEAHHSETKVQTADAPGKKPDEFLAALEQMLKNRQKDSSSNYHGNNKAHRYRRPDQDKYNPGSKGEHFRDTKLRDFMTPPQPHSHRPKGHYYDKPGKKRPPSGPLRYNHYKHYHGPRSHPRQYFAHKTGGAEASASNLESIYADGFPQHDSRQRTRSEFKKGSSLDSYSFSTPIPDSFFKGSKHRIGSVDKENHPKVHNLYGLLMKNKQLPEGGPPNYFRKQQLYDDTLNNYFYKMSEGSLYSNFGRAGSDARRSLPELQKSRA